MTLSTFGIGGYPTPMDAIGMLIASVLILVFLAVVLFALISWWRWASAAEKLAIVGGVVMLAAGAAFGILAWEAVR